MSKQSIAHIFLEANPRSALILDTGYNEMFAQLTSSLAAGRNGRTFQFFGRGPTADSALQALDANIAASGITVESFAFPGHTQQELEEARENAIAKMRQQIAEEEAAAIKEACENAKQEAFLRLTEEVGLADAAARRVIASIERQARLLQ